MQLDNEVNTYLNKDRFAKRAHQPAFSQAVLSRQSGFTLLEMLVVAAILLVVAGGIVVSFGNLGSDSSEQAARFQMQQIGEAIENYYKDNGSFPSDRESPADLSFLFLQPASTAAWNIDYRLGWRGPYLNGRKYLYVDIGDDLATDGTSVDDSSVAGEPNLISSSEVEVIAIADPFTHYPVEDGVEQSFEACLGSSCLFEWRKISGDNATLLGQFGRPYLAIDLEHLGSNTGVARLVSFGENGIYEPESCDYPFDETIPGRCSRDELCTSSGDDIVLCLR